jgi:pimeloyl-ACP methyl ester carboxylesterase
MPLAYDRAGDGAPLVLIHPLGADRQVWKPVLGRLAAERDVIAVDLPGFGESPSLNGGGPPTPAALARAVASLLDELGLPDAHTAGNSLGGWVALELALAGRARSVTAIAPAGLWPRPYGPKPEVARKLARAALPLLSALVRIPAFRRIALAATVARPDRMPAGDAAALVRAYASAPGFTAVSAAMRSNRLERLDAVRTPVTFAWCEHDRLIARPKRLPSRMRNVVLRGCGHVPMWDDPGLVAATILEGSGAAS